MYKIMVDGQEVYSPALSNDLEHQILSPSLQLEIDTAGSLSFILPPGHKEYDSFHKLKSVVTMELDGVEIFRGRVLEEKTDAYNQKEIYCEGDLSLLLDSVQRPFKHESITKRAFIEQAIAKHNEQVEEYKRFTMGDFSALTDDAAIPLESDGYADTLSAIRAVLEPHEGYLFARYEKGTRYLDFLTTHSANTGQAIEFGVNLVDLDNQTAAGELCTVLLPIGGMLEDGTTVTIASVNGGKDTIEDAEAIAQYGRIVKTYAFDDITDPAELLKLAQEKLASMAISETLILKAVDMHLLDETKGIILPGIPVLIHTKPHGFDKQQKLCTALDLDPDNPEDATYTFGKPEKTQSGAAALIASKVEKHTRTVEKLYKHYTETDYKVNIQAGLLDGHGEYISQAFFEIDGINATIKQKAEKEELNDLTGEMEKLETEMLLSADGVRTAIQEGEQTISELNATVAGLEHWVTDADGNVAELTNTVRGLESTVATADGRVVTLTNTADGLKSIITAQGVELSALRAKVDEISATVRGTNGAMGQLVVKSDSITQKVVSADKKLTGKIEVLAGLINMETKADGSVVSLRLDAAEKTLSAKADKIDLKGYVTMEAFEALEGQVDNLWSEQLIVNSVSANNVTGGTADFDNLVFGTIAGQSADTWVAGKVSGLGYATRSWVTGTALTPYATQAWVMANFVHK